MADNYQSPRHVDIPHRYRSFQALFPTCRPQYTVFPTVFFQALSDHDPQRTAQGRPTPILAPPGQHIQSSDSPLLARGLRAVPGSFSGQSAGSPHPELPHTTCAPGYSDTSSWRRPQSADETGCARKPSAAQMSRHSRSWPRITFSPSTLWHSRQIASTSS
jgi:hypothetical protein